MPEDCIFTKLIQDTTKQDVLQALKTSSTNLNSERAEVSSLIEEGGQ